MKIILLTQDDPFYLAETTEDFIQKIKKTKKHEIISAILTDASPFGKKENALRKAMKTLKIFGPDFFLHYSIRFLVRKVLPRKNVRAVLKKHQIPVLQIKSSINKDENVKAIKELGADIIIIIAGNQIIKKQILEIPPHGVINAHSSLLPEYKGLMPTFWVLKNNEKVTGVTVYRLTEGIDDGPIINQAKIPIESNTTQSLLVQQCKYLANTLIIESLELLVHGNSFKENTGGGFFKFPTRKDVKQFYKNGKKFF
jgi:methionyl-tRNA formyltransferase